MTVLSSSETEVRKQWKDTEIQYATESGVSSQSKWKNPGNLGSRFNTANNLIQKSVRMEQMGGKDKKRQLSSK